MLSALTLPQTAATWLNSGMQPRFLYFDMGNVLLHFSHEREAEQMAAVAGVSPNLVRKILFEDGLHWAYERGDLTREQFYARFCELVGAKPDLIALNQAANDIFELNVRIVALLGQLAHAGYPLGILSNTSGWHWYSTGTPGGIPRAPTARAARQSAH